MFDKTKGIFGQRLKRKGFILQFIAYIIICAILRVTGYPASLAVFVVIIFLSYFVFIVVSRCNDIDLSTGKKVLVIVLLSIPVVSLFILGYLMKAKSKSI